ncbi:MAG: hypothetical protein EZS28_051535, partial [Streblomastix strix]
IDKSEVNKEDQSELTRQLRRKDQEIKRINDENKKLQEELQRVQEEKKKTEEEKKLADDRARREGRRAQNLEKKASQFEEKQKMIDELLIQSPTGLSKPLEQTSYTHILPLQTNYRRATSPGINSFQSPPLTASNQPANSDNNSQLPQQLLLKSKSSLQDVLSVQQQTQIQPNALPVQQQTQNIPHSRSKTPSKIQLKSPSTQGNNMYGLEIGDIHFQLENTYPQKAVVGVIGEIVRKVTTLIRGYISVPIDFTVSDGIIQCDFRFQNSSKEDGR